MDIGNKDGSSNGDPWTIVAGLGFGDAVTEPIAVAVIEAESGEALFLSLDQFLVVDFKCDLTDVDEPFDARGCGIDPSSKRLGGFRRNTVLRPAASVQNQA